MPRAPSRQRRALPKWRQRRISSTLHLSLCLLLLVAIAIWRASPSVEIPRAHVLSTLGSAAAAAAASSSAVAQGNSRVVPHALASRRDALFAGSFIAAGTGVQSANAEFVAGISGLKYEVIKEGVGDPCVEGEQVQIYYEIYVGGFPKPGKPKGYPDPASMNDGKYPKLLKSSRTKVVSLDPDDKDKFTQTPKQFEAGADYADDLVVTQTIRGLSFGVIGMRVGEVRNYIVPPSMAYAPNAKTFMPKNTTLYVELRLHGKGMPDKSPMENYYGQKPRYKRSFKNLPNFSFPSLDFFGGGGNNTATDNSSTAPRETVEALAS
mmetsp:Transcript_113173/g.225356  ORF Transcript_113173/g.225356 Transcript_113173/m.225356 type:complete len:321 (+) Transcript_113173:43-1005(+)